MFIPKAALKTNMELVKLFGIRCINGGHQVFQSSLESNQLTEGILQKSVESTKQYHSIKDKMLANRRRKLSRSQKLKD